jgi:hypothetical protein
VYRAIVKLFYTPKKNFKIFLDFEVMVTDKK